MRSFSSMNESESCTASALTIASRSRSWISLSNASVAELIERPCTRCKRPLEALFTGFFSAIVVPRDPETEQDVETAETDRHADLAPRRGREQREGPEQHERK